MDPGLVQERMRPGPGGVDRALRCTAMPFFLAVFVLAGLDARFHWSHVPATVQVVGLVLIAGGYSVSLWTIRHNRFFSPVVRIQAERGHVLVTSGPYAHVRHPGYAATLIVLLATGLALGSWWAVLPWLAVTPLIFRRIWIEERYLRANLPGYEEYAGRVRWRLVAGVW
jgi:protein-S-isoprenylcysteine O-methyltransferase Ste14